MKQREETLRIDNRQLKIDNRQLRIENRELKIDNRQWIRALVLLSIIYFQLSIVSLAQSSTVRLGLLKYSGGGDWYANPTSLPNLIKFCNENLHTTIDPKPVTIEPGSRDLFNLPFVHLTGHGNVVFSDLEAANLRKYLLAGGFLHIDDNYGLDPFIRREMKKVFPDADFIEIPPDHPIYQSPYYFENGLPKIHEHDNNRPQGFGIFREKRLVCYYTYEADLGDGWEDPGVHQDSQETRLKALRMGANLVSYVFTKNSGN